MNDGKLTDVKIEGTQLEHVIQQAVSNLPSAQREAFALREEAGFSVNDIASIQGISSEAAKSRLRYAYKKLRHELRGKVT